MSWNNVGIGLGSFASGFANGIGIANQIDETRARREELEAKRENREERKAFDANAQAEFDKQVAAGNKQPSDAGEFLLNYKGPQRTAMLMKQGDYAGARAWKEWYTSEAAEKGAKLFGSAMFKAQTGDISGSIDDAVSAAQVKGYLDHSMKLVSKDQVTDAKGNVTGYRVRLNDGDGEDVVWDVDANNILSGLGSIFNPEAAYKSILDSKANREKTKLELESYGVKKGIDDKCDSRKSARDHANDLDLAKAKKALGGEGAPPADVANAEWLAKKTAAAEGREVTDQDMLDAYKEIRTSKDNPNGRAALVTRIYEGMAKDTFDDRPNSVKLAEARTFVEGLYKESKASAKKPKESGASAEAQEIPEEVRGEPEGTIVENDDGARFEIRGGKLVPVK